MAVRLACGSSCLQSQTSPVDLGDGDGRFHHLMMMRMMMSMMMLMMALLLLLLVITVMIIMPPYHLHQHYRYTPAGPRHTKHH